MKKTVNIVFICVVMAVLFAIPCATYLSEKETFSVFENRNLALKPELTRDSVMSGDYFDGAETYFKDHIVLRDTMLKNYTKLQIDVLKKPVVSDIIVSDEELLPYVALKNGEHASNDEINASVAQLSALSDTVSSYGGEFFYIGVPGQITMFSELYPDYLSDIPSYNIETEKLFAAALEENGVNFIAARDILNKENYFLTDHHYDLTGGYKIYKAICDAAGVEAVPESEFNYTTLPNTFYGSRSRKIYNLTPLEDKLTVVDPYTDIPFTRRDNGVDVPSSVINMPKGEDEIVSYTQYMGGDKAETVIRTNREELPNILIYGDSYTNAVECFAYLSFNEARYIDLRHYNATSLCEYVKMYQPDYVFCIRDDGQYVNLEGNGRVSTLHP
ncbi:MAG: hypothetical protein E7652_03395 [Ruminococcaceae bacterium]|nr:hypothetical protein [Oscillospiraceae bacterium]